MLLGLFSRSGGGGSAGTPAATHPTRKPSKVPPPLLPEERSGNLSVLERELNKAMKCPAGMNQVFIRSLVTSRGPTPPRIALKCIHRRDNGQTPDVYLEHIRGTCCGDPEKCEAYRAFKERFVRT